MGLGIPCPILNAGYGQWVISAFTMHNAACPPIPPSPTALPGLLEGPMPMGNPAGTLSHKKALTVLVDGNPGVKQGHDVGYMIPHFAIPMNALCAVNTLLSKHKVMFPISSVQLKGSPVGTYLAFLFGEICCNPVSLPTGVVLLFKCTVWTSPSVGDLIKGVLYIAMDILVDKLWSKFVSKNPLFEKLFKFFPEKNAIANRCARTLLLGFTLQPNAGIFTVMAQGGARLAARYMLPQLGNKAIDHLLKSWVVSPLVTGAARGSPSVGRGDYSYKFFDAKWW